METLAPFIGEQIKLEKSMGQDEIDVFVETPVEEWSTFQLQWFLEQHGYALEPQTDPDVLRAAVEEELLCGGEL